MNRLLYNVFLHTVAAPFLAAYYVPRIILGNKYRRSILGKLGRLSPEFTPEQLPRPRIWFHAVSVGEVVALDPLVLAMRAACPGASIIVSTGTETGQDKARTAIQSADGFLYLPIDFPACVNPVVDRIRPDLFVLMETELWPNLIHRLKRCGAIVALANGRISDRSFPRYKLLSGFFSSVLAEMDRFLMASALDAERVAAMGAPKERILITGNTKFDALPADASSETVHEMRAALDIGNAERIWVAGSTHPGEHEMVLDAYRTLAHDYPDLILVLVPRHVEKTPAIVSAMSERGMEPPFLRSAAERGEKRSGRKTVVVDRTGELFRIYALASVVFVGGSLVPKGGQNILEPAAWGKVILFGPSMADFRDARDMLVRAGAGIEVRTEEDLTRQVRQVLANPQRAEELGGKGRDEIFKHVGSARRNADLLAQYLKCGTS
jgi:3-deoxy-D-manno-octulosonic-acid transferase